MNLMPLEDLLAALHLALTITLVIGLIASRLQLGLARRLNARYRARDAEIEAAMREIGQHIERLVEIGQRTAPPRDLRTPTDSP